MVTLRARVRSYKDADEFLGGRARRILGHNTVIRYEVELEAISISLHDNKIVTYYKDGKIGISSCGYLTRTTKDRINQLIPIHLYVYQSEGVWHLQNTTTSKDRLFFDGMSL